MHSHIKLVGILNIVWNGFWVLCALALFAVVATGGSFLGLAAAASEPAAGAGIAGFLIAFGGIVGCAIGLPALPGLLAGIGVLRYGNVSRIVLIIVSAWNLFYFPIGTALGVYSLVVLLHKDSEQVFANPDIDPKPII